MENYSNFGMNCIEFKDLSKSFLHCFPVDEYGIGLTIFEDFMSNMYVNCIRLNESCIHFLFSVNKINFYI